MRPRKTREQIDPFGELPLGTANFVIGPQHHAERGLASVANKAVVRAALASK
jgi:hypothetical protein